MVLTAFPLVSKPLFPSLLPSPCLVWSWSPFAIFWLFLIQSRSFGFWPPLLGRKFYCSMVSMQKTPKGGAVLFSWGPRKRHRGGDYNLIIEYIRLPCGGMCKGSRSLAWLAHPSACHEAEARSWARVAEEAESDQVSWGPCESPRCHPEPLKTVLRLWVGFEYGRDMITSVFSSSPH